MNRFWIPLAALAGALVVVVAVVSAGGLIATRAFANGAGPHGAPWSTQMPAELRGLGAIPAADRFDHFKGATVNLTDANGQPMSVTVTPGTVSSVNGGSLSLAANDGSTHTYTLTDATMTRDKAAPTANEKVAVVTLNGSSTATAVMTVPAGGFGPHAH
jgi:hypothetical protein